MYKWLCEGFDTLGIKPNIKMPSIQDVYESGMPISILRCDLEEAYKYGGDIVRSLIDQAPLKNDKNNMVFRFELKYIIPGFQPVSTVDWHIDGSGHNIYRTDDRTHILIGPTSNLTTQFLEYPVIIKDENDIMNMEFYKRMQYVEEHANEYSFVPKHVNTKEWITFTSRHFHKVERPIMPEYRMFVEVLESTGAHPLPWKDSIRDYSAIYLQNRQEKQRKSLIRTGPKTVVINPYWEEEGHI